VDIGIIGGADGPTSIFITASINPFVIAIIAIICIAVVGVVFWKLYKSKS
jgi:Na+-transporting methylmalonyl-CoA/oxaloacetate decarboxylase beta subunit